jgi:hypothetical protein
LKINPVLEPDIGADFVAKSIPDGYTWLMASVGTHGINLLYIIKGTIDYLSTCSGF